jgi:hypothetical protein
MKRKNEINLGQIYQNAYSEDDCGFVCQQILSFDGLRKIIGPYCALQSAIGLSPDPVKSCPYPPSQF